MNKVSNKKIMLLAFFAGMCLAFLLSFIIYHYEPFELSAQNVMGSLVSGGIAMLFIAVYEIKKDKLIQERKLG